MGKALIMAEKPSVAADLAKALGGFTRKPEGFYENDQYVLTNGIGHLVEIDNSQIQSPPGKYGLDALPLIPESFPLRPVERTVDQFKLVKRLMCRPDVDRLINACDAGREGELIFWYTATAAGTSGKPMQRLWLQSMTPESIREAFRKMRSKESMQSMIAAAISRSEADWIVGINGSRAVKEIKGEKSPVGRVQTPTLALVVDREIRIQSFKPRPFFEVVATVAIQAGNFTGTWFNPSFAPSDIPGLEQSAQSASRLWDRAQAEAVLNKCIGQTPSSIRDESKPTSKAAPLLFDLTALQRTANVRYSFSAKRTLELAQALYEKHKVLTYPRTDSRALPEDYLGKVVEVMTTLQGLDGLAPHAKRVLDNQWVKPTKRIFDNAKVSDHFAIIPTGKVPVGLDPDEAKIFDLVARQFIAAFHPAAQYLVTKRTTVIAGEHFSTTGKVLTSPGWLLVFGRVLDEEEDKDSGPSLPALAAGERGETQSVDIKQGETKAPDRYTEATLLSAMESAGKVIEDEALREAMKEKGLGTPATRAAIIEKLIADENMTRDGKSLVPSKKGMELIALVREMGLNILSSAELTGSWEAKLNRMANGQYSREQFMTEIAAMTGQIVEAARRKGPAKSGGSSPLKETGLTCPACQQAVVDAGKIYRCTACDDFAVWKEIAGRKVSVQELGTLITARKTGLLSGFLSKVKKPFSAMLKLVRDEGGGKFQIAFEFPPHDPSAPPPAGDPHYPCPVCKTSNLARRQGKTGYFWGCSSYPNCKHTQPDDNGKPGVRPESVAGKDHGHGSGRSSGAAKHKAGEKCPNCGKGDLVSREMKGSGKAFIGCTQYPSCNFFQWP